MELAKSIIRLRKQKGMTQEELGSILGVSTAAVSKWETENSIPDIYMLSELADFFQVTTDELLGRNICKVKVAIADDSTFVREKTKQILVQNNYQVLIQAENGQKLLDHPSLPKVQAVVLDIDMPELDGMETLKILKENYPHIHVVMCSADSSEEMIQNAKALGADAYVTKPFQDRFLLDALIA